MKRLCADVLAGVMVVCSIAGAAWGLQGLWVHGWRWLVYVVGAIVCVLILGTIGSSILGEQ